jgi:MFS superfamily sulfate permease-like transporter
MIDQKTWSRDLLASFVVFMVALPLSMGIAIASGVPPALGLISAIIGGIVVGLLAGSPLQVSGPAAGLAVIVLELVQKHGVRVLIPVLLLTGVLQLACGYLKWGRVFRAVSPPVVYGMLAGIGVLIFASQFHVMVDDAPKRNGIENLISIPQAVYKGLVPVEGSSHHIAAGIGLLTIILLVGWAKFRPARLGFLPAPLVGAGLTTLISDSLGLPVNNVEIPSRLLDAAQWVGWADVARLAEWQIVGAGLAVALVASTETLLCAAATDRLHTGPRTNFDRELVAQGAGNFLCGLCGALPMTGVIVRSSVNVAAGAKTRWSAVLHGVWLLIFVWFLPDVLRKIPTAALAAILVHTGYKLVDRSNIRKLRQYGRAPVAIYLATLLGIVITDLLTGVMIGVALTLVRLIYQVSHLRVHLEQSEGRADLRLDGAATFLGLPKIAEVLDSLPPGVELHVHLDHLTHIDHACLDALENWEQQNARRGSRLVVEWDELWTRHHRTISGAAANGSMPLAATEIRNGK